ncbi:receptor-like serine/threonine-protein kinase SD1-8 isoform X1 [Momordica charantia]|uniref:Receptor-like serine/threonine-protein kinase n=2 Tax=Momordica charantia TaxID=3673 RepID=A0A6J1CGR7_MOMCH|nr:receptor-like serine/threonine-protein kinase SD1-8 isoform X1 [Momordica charantia]
MENLTPRFNFLCLIFFWTLVPLFLRRSIAGNSIKAGEPINDTQSIVSAAQKFELGFFSVPKGSSFKYLGIWYKNIPETVVWVANRDNPIVNSSATLNFSGDGNLVLVNQTGAAFWSSNSTISVKTPVAQLLDSGNLVLKDSGSEIPLWQSFDYPSDTLLPGMKLGWESKTGLTRKLTSWRSPNDPSSGEFSYSLNTYGLPQFVVRKGNKTMFRGWPWYDHDFGQGYGNGFTYDLVYDAATEISYSYNDSTNWRTRIVMDSGGSVQNYEWSDVEKEWHKSFTFDGVGCNDYDLCGNFGVCSSVVTASCGCLDGFKQKSGKDISCVRKDPDICRAGDGFKKISKVKWPDSTGELVKMKLGIQNCGAECLKDCSCLAYGTLEFPNIGLGCITWSHKLIDVRFVPEVGLGDDLYVRVAASEFESANKKRRIAVVVVVPIISAIIFLALAGGWFIIRRRGRADNEVAVTEPPIQENELEMPIAVIEAATDNFSASNKIGEGGFGPVYKGKLSSGQEIAVKKLAESSGQGLQEFKTEVLFISQLQHRNLVKLLGFCIQNEEILLIYEYMPNKSLDCFLFDDQMRCLLNWTMRIDIIIGIARGLLYLHRDSRLRIIHRDLKVANILLDNEMKPKISDFGIARMFGEDQTETKTKRVVGTYGYMSPEYAIDGYFSVKSDVFSFGVMVLEIISGKKNKGFFHPEHQLNLLGHAWKLWNEGRALELIDVMLEDQFQESEVLRCINIGLLCVQRRPEERPTMSTVVSMLENENMSLILPERPGFYEERFITSDIDSSLGDQLTSTSNNVTVTLLDGR